MNIRERLFAVYPELAKTPEVFINGTIELQNDSDGYGDYVREWNHPTLALPHDEEKLQKDADNRRNQRRRDLEKKARLKDERKDLQ